MAGPARRTGALSQPVYVTEPIDVTLSTTDIEIGAVEIKNGTDDTRAVVNPAGRVSTIHYGVTSTTSNVASSVTVVTLKAANTSRVKLVVYHDDTASTLYVKEGSAATATDYTYKLSPGSTLFIDDYTGIVTGIWSAATGTARVTETV
jgi:hypothetical protein